MQHVDKHKHALMLFSFVLFLVIVPLSPYVIGTRARVMSRKNDLGGGGGVECLSKGKLFITIHITITILY